MVFVLPGGLGQIKAAPPGFSALDPANKNANVVLSNNNLTVTGPSTTLVGGCVRGTGARTSGKLYFEATLTVLNTQNQGIGVCSSSFAITTAALIGGDSSGYSAGAVASSASSVWSDYGFGAPGPANSLAAPASGDTAMVAYDFSASAIYLGVNGLWFVGQSTTFPSGNPDFTMTFATAYPAISVSTVGGVQGSVTINVGASAFKYTVPAGYSKWG